MNVTNFISTVWDAAAGGEAMQLGMMDTPLHSPTSSTDSKGMDVEMRRAISEAESPKRRRRVKFTLPLRLYAWLEDMAVAHNYGSVHKSVRDLLSWASTGEEDDMEWVFGTPHEIPPCLGAVRMCKIGDQEPTSIAGKQAGVRRAEGAIVESVVLETRLPRILQEWIEECVVTYGLPGPSEALDAICRSVIELDAAHDVFESEETGKVCHIMSKSSADLYHDLGIGGFSRSRGRGVDWTV